MLVQEEELNLAPFVSCSRIDWASSVVVLVGMEDEDGWESEAPTPMARSALSMEGGWSKGERVGGK